MAQPSPNANAQGNLHSSDNPASSLNDQVLRIEAHSGSRPGLGRRLVPLTGSCPSEEPTWYDLSHKIPDGRDLPPLVIRYESQQEDDLFSQRNEQDRVRRAVWSSLGKLLPTKALPQVTFDVGRPLTHGATGLIDLSFPTSSAFASGMKHLVEIRVGIPGSDSRFERVYTMRRFATTLPGCVLRIDCLNLPLNEETEREAFFSAMDHMTASIGQLLGIAKIVVTSSKGLPESSAGIHRLYVQLDRIMVGTPLYELAARLPSHVLWHGVAYKIFFTGSHLRLPLLSADYPPMHNVGPSNGASVEGSGASDSSHKRRRESEDG